MSTLYDKVKAGELLFLDGGTATTLAQKGVAHEEDPCWTARAVLKDPDVLREVHKDFIDAGAQVIIANTFRASRHNLIAGGLEEEFSHINTRAVELAYEAITQAGKEAEVHVASAIMPLRDKATPLPSPEQERADFAEQAKLQAAAGSEAILIEKIGSLERGLAAVEGAQEAGIALWIGFVCRVDENGVPHLKDDGTLLVDAISAFSTYPITVMGLMHTIVGDVNACMGVLRENWIGPVCVRPHATSNIIPGETQGDAWTPERYRKRVLTWLKSGVRLLGGCYGITPDHIRALREGIQFLG